MKKCFSYIFIGYFFCYPKISISQEININKSSIGMIYVDSFFAGTGFVAIKPNLIITAAHCLMDSTRKINYKSQVIFGNQKRDKIIIVKIKQVFLNDDIAILEAPEIVSNQPLQLGSFKDLKLGDSISYFGYQSYDSSKPSALRLYYDFSQIRSKGITLGILEFPQAEYIEFLGMGKPGWSGGPVFNSAGQVVGILSQGWIWEGIKVKERFLYHRAFSLKMLSKLNL